MNKEEDLVVKKKEWTENNDKKKKEVNEKFSINGMRKMRRANKQRKGEQPHD